MYGILHSHNDNISIFVYKIFRENVKSQATEFYFLF